MAVLHWTHPHTDSSSTLFDYGNVEWWKRSNFFCNVSVYLTLKVKVVSYFPLLFLIIMYCSFSVTTSNDSFHLPSSYCLVKNVIRSTNCSASEIDFIAKESLMVTSSLSISIFLPGSFLETKLNGKTIIRGGGYGLEVSCKYGISGQEKAVDK